MQSLSFWAQHVESGKGFRLISIPCRDFSASALSRLKKNWLRTSQFIRNPFFIILHDHFPQSVCIFGFFWAIIHEKKMGDHDFIPRSLKKKTVFKHRNNKNIFSFVGKIQVWLPGQCVCHAVSQNMTLITRKITLKAVRVSSIKVFRVMSNWTVMRIKVMITEDEVDVLLTSPHYFYTSDNWWFQFWC